MARKIVYKKSGLNSQPTTPNGYKFVGYDNDTFSEKDGDIITPIGAEGGGGIIFIERSLPDLHTDVSNGVLIPGATYKITGVHKAHTIDNIQISALYDDGRDLGTTIFLKAISENELETFGSGVFYNPKYDKQVQGFGIWSNTTSYSVDDVVFWGGYAWKNLNGNIGTDTDIFSLNGEWEKLNYDDVNYNKVVDYIEYDIEKDLITRRYDTVNEIDVSNGFSDIAVLKGEEGIDFSSISLMQWGNDFYFGSGKPPVKVGVGKISVKHMSFVELINFKGSFIYNVTLDNGSRLNNVTLDNGSYLNNVTLDNRSRLNNVTFDNGSYLNNVTLNNGSGLSNVTLNGSYLTNVAFDNVSGLSNVTLDNQSGLSNVTLDNQSSLDNVTFDNSRMRHNTFINFGANFNNQTYSNLEFSNIKFEGWGGFALTIPDISNGVLINPNIRQKKVFGIDYTTQKIQYWDSVNSNFAIVDITD